MFAGSKYPSNAVFKFEDSHAVQDTADEAREKRVKKEAEAELKKRREVEAQIARALEAEQIAASSTERRPGDRRDGDGGIDTDRMASGGEAQPRKEFVRDADAAPLTITLATAVVKEREPVGTKRPPSLFADDGFDLSGMFASRAKKPKVDLLH